MSYLIEPMNGKIRPANKIADSLGIEVGTINRNSEALEGCKGMTYIQNKKAYIFIADDLPIEAQRITLTHELSHIFLGHFLGFDDDRFKVPYAQAEFEAESLGFILYNFLYGIDGGRVQ